MAEGARLESVYTATYRGFESLSLRQIQNNRPCGGFFVASVWCFATVRPFTAVINIAHCGSTSYSGLHVHTME